MHVMSYDLSNTHNGISSQTAITHQTMIQTVISIKYEICKESLNPVPPRP